MAFKVLATDSDGRTTRFSMRRPDNWHGHVRQGIQMRSVVAASAQVYGRMTIMPNTGPVMTVAEAELYQDQIVSALVEKGLSAERAERFPQMTLYLHRGMTDEIRRAKTNQIIGVKFYPKNPTHGTTGSQAGVPSLQEVDEELQALDHYQVPLLVHGESARHSDILDLERRFVEEQLAPVMQKYPDLPLVVEHATTKEAIEFVVRAPPNVTATITPQHLWYSLNSLFEGGLRPFRYCLPLYKHAEDQAALIKAAISGNPKFCAGDDTAPHPERGPKGKAKLADCGCAGAYVAPVSVPMYAQAFEKAGALDERFEAFMSVNGAKTRHLPLNTDEIVLERKPWKVPESYGYGNSDIVVPLCAGEELAWQVVQS